MQQTHTVVLELLLVLAVLQGQDPVQERLVALLAQLDNTGQVQGQDAVFAQPTSILVQEQHLALLVLLGKFLVLDPLHQPLVTMVILILTYEIN